MTASGAWQPGDPVYREEQHPTAERLGLPHDGSDPVLAAYGLGYAQAMADRLAEAVDGCTPYERDSDASGRPPGFYLRDGSGQVFQVTVTAFTCRVCGEVLSEARSALGLTLCSGACHRAATVASGYPKTCEGVEDRATPTRQAAAGHVAPEGRASADPDASPRSTPSRTSATSASSDGAAQ